MNGFLRHSAVIGLIFLVCAPVNSFGDVNGFKERGKFNIGPTLFIGVGFKNNKVGATSDGSDVNISGGEGIGYGVMADYALSEPMQVSLTAGAQKSHLNPLVTNAEGEFSRVPIFLTVKRMIADFSGKSRLKAGAGIGLYNSGKLTLTSDELNWHEEVNYDPSVGFHATLDYESFFGKSSSWTVGLRVSAVSYNANKYEVRGLELPIGLLNPDFKTVDGGGIDFVFAIEF